MSDDTDRTDIPPADPFTMLWRRLKDHRIAQWTVGYVAVAYGIQHAIILTSESFEWPNIVARVTMLLLILGVPVAMTLAWYRGERANRRMSAGELSILSALLVIASVLFYAFVRPATEVRTAAAPIAQEASVTAARQASLSAGTAISLAVIPFENLSPDPNQGYFADGMGEEITTALAKIPDLRVVGRESAQAFKGKNAIARDIGHALNATHLLEGSVRKAGDRLRITAQLVRADTGVTLWANAYDRQDADVFAIQEDVARSIAASLHMALPLKPGEELVNQRTKDAALHDEYLRARSLVVTQKFDDAIKVLGDLVAREPGYAPAWAELSVAQQESLLPLANRLVRAGDAATMQLFRDKVEKRNAAAEQALKLDPQNAGAICHAAFAQMDRGDFIAAGELAQRALALDPDDPDCLEAYGLNVLAALGFPDKALPVMNHLVAVEPLRPDFQSNRARVLLIAGQTDAAVAALKAMGGGNGLLAVAAVAQGHLAEAADLLETAPALRDLPDVKAAAIRLLRAAPAAAPPEMPKLNIYDFVYAATGSPERFMGMFEDRRRIGFWGGGQNGLEWIPAFRSVRQTARFKAYIHDSGILAYWRAKGWPPQCHPATGDDFECN